MMKLLCLSLTMGSLLSGQIPEIFTLKNAAGMEARITNYGGIVMSLKTPDRVGKLDDVVLGFDTPEEYKRHTAPYFGALIGRYGNRIGKAQFTLDGTSYGLVANNGANALHGGTEGFDKKVWPAVQEGNKLTLSYTSPDGEEGYPGELRVRVIYELTAANELKIDYHATTNKPTVLNLTNHSYFNLSGGAGKDILGHELKLRASRYTPVDAGLIPTGELRSVKKSPFDFLTAHKIGTRIDAPDEQIHLGGGYDHNFVLDRKTVKGLEVAAEVYDPASGRTLTVLTTEPAVQLYTGNFLDGSFAGKGGVTYTKRKAFCLETQHFPDSPNKAEFPTTTLRPGDEYKSTTVFRFGVR